MSAKLKDRNCGREKGLRVLEKEETAEYMKELNSGWRILRGIKIRKKYECGSLADAIKFVNEVAKLAEKENHHPDISIFYGTVEIELSTHSLGGLSENDFILAAKIDSKR